MNQPRLRSMHSPLTPLTPFSPMSQSSFDFSPNALKLSLEASNSTTPAIFKSRLSYLPDYMNTTSDLSPMDFDFSVPHLANQKLISPCITITNELNSSLDMSDESFNVTGNNDKSMNTSNINNHRFNVTNILIDLKLEQYSTIFEKEEIDFIVFLSLNDEDLQLLGVKDEGHREKFLHAINEFKYCSG